MKVSIGSRIVEGPWGGGNLFAINLRDYLVKHGHEVIFDLSDKDIDLILLTDPRSKKESSSTFNHIDILNYKTLINPNVSVVQRINECDERKNTDNINQLYLEASNISDRVIFVSSWLRDIYTNLGLNKNKTSVILAGANKNIFNDDNFLLWDGKEKLKIVTHHWSSHRNKGFQTYEELDNLLLNNKWKNQIEFSYIGNLSSEYPLPNTKVSKPLHDIELAKELKKNHVYITASENEPSGNHHIEAAQCGLPLIYLDSGGIPEYCKGYGVKLEQLEKSLEIMQKNYLEYKEALKRYPFSSDLMCREFLNIFETLLKEKLKNKKDFKVKPGGHIYLFNNKIRKISNKFRVTTETKIKIKKLLGNK
jgi:glycosyltransferase involved in cell wall biosynthesis